MTSRFTLPAFTAYGIELEYAIVDEVTCDVVPVAEPLLASLEENRRSRESLGGWSNELVSHVVELKNVEPIPLLEALPDAFQREVRAANRALRRLGARLLPTGMHPWMDPRTETALWTASDAAIYRTYDRLFDCRRHGWANLQSMHINLPFADDREFARLHTAIRLVLPLVPALAASSPFAEGAGTGFRDYRLAVYATNSSRFPSITGAVVPDVVRSRREYERHVLAPMYDAIADIDPDGVLRHEWLNAHGAIARFDRNAIEIRLADAQECPLADLAIASGVSAAVRALFEERRSGEDAQAALETAQLAQTLRRTMRDGEEAVIDDARYLAALGLSSRSRSARAVWDDLLNGMDIGLGRVFDDPLSFILTRGTLASRLVGRLGETPLRSQLHEVYAELCDCLDQGRMFS
jgi:gamma-glutamyl:cysteine ligase YbdK (ATP-grasp superfamily)